jgi:hypothetical protein
MTRSFRARRITQPLGLISRPRDPAIDSHTFMCFRLVDGAERVVAMRVHHSDNRMFVFARVA